MKKILFVCHGNICRSPMAECVMKNMVKDRGIAGEFYIDSAATSREEIGNPIYPPAVRKLKAEGVPLTGHRAIQMTKADYDKYDLLLAADSANVRNMTRIAGGDPGREDSPPAGLHRPPPGHCRPLVHRELRHHL